MLNIGIRDKGISELNNDMDSRPSSTIVTQKPLQGRFNDSINDDSVGETEQQ